MSKTVTPNLYQLSGQHLHVTYSTTSLDGKPILTYQDSHQGKSFKGGVTTMHSTSFAPQLDHGQLDTYTTTALHGTAQFVLS